MSGAQVFSPCKVDVHADRVRAYERGERIYPVTIELDLTQRCTRACPCCPYASARTSGLTLSLEFLDRLFGVLGPHTPGLVVSGGEATAVPHYPQVLALARSKGFREISTISNGTRLHRPEVLEALLRHGTAIRVSLYDWQERDEPAFSWTLRRIEDLRRRIDTEGSALQIGASILTRAEWLPRMGEVARKAHEAGAHWVYFHPFCVGWEEQHPRRAGQAGVLEAIDAWRRELPEANLQVPTERYQDYPLVFSELHAGHFLMQIGADGVNYAGPECKYDPDYALLDLNGNLRDDFLWHPPRQAMLKSIHSGNYRCIGTRHRPPMFSDHLQRELAAAGPRDGADRTLFIHPFLI